MYSSFHYNINIVVITSDSLHPFVFTKKIPKLFSMLSIHVESFNCTRADLEEHTCSCHIWIRSDCPIVNVELLSGCKYKIYSYCKFCIFNGLHFQSIQYNQYLHVLQSYVLNNFALLTFKNIFKSVIYLKFLYTPTFKINSGDRRS